MAPAKRPRRKERPSHASDDYQRRLEAYCAQYGVSPTATGLPPFPAGRRETPQHREWISLYKAHRRLAGSRQVE